MKSDYELLLIEDNPGDARLIYEMLDSGKNNYALTSCDTLEKGVNAFLTKKFDAVLLDLSLPDSYGIDTIEQIKAKAPDTAIVVLTALNDEAIVNLIVNAGAQDYVPKDSMDSFLLMRSIQYAIERNKILTELKGVSLFDELTGLYNRRGFFTLADHQIKIARRTRKSFLLFFMDIDRMKWINDNLGHSVGDQALIDAAVILKGVFRDTDIVARLGGDEFVVLVLDSDESSREDFLKRFTYKLDDHKGKPYKLSISVGVVSYNPDEDLSLEFMLDRADAYMYNDKYSKYLHGNSTDKTR